MKIDISKKDVFWNYIGIFVSIASNFILIPVLLKFLSINYYGLWNVFISLGAFSTLFDFGFNSLFAHNIAYCWSGVDHLEKENVQKTNKKNKTNYLLLKKVIKTCKFIYLIISSVALCAYITLGSIYVLRVGEQINNNGIVLSSWILYSIGIFLDLLYGYYDAFLRGIGEIASVNKARVISKFIQIILTIILLISNFGIIGVSISNIIYGLIFRGFCKRKFYGYENMKEKLDDIGTVASNDIKDVFLIVWHNAWREGIVSIANYLSSQSTTLLCSFYLGLKVTASYGLVVQLTSGIASVSSSHFASYMPAVQEAYAHRDIKKIKQKLSYGLGIYLILFPMGIICVLLLIPLINMIKSANIISIPVLLEIGGYQYLINYLNCYAWYLGGTNRVFYYKSFLYASIFCVLLSFFFVGILKMQILGFVLAQLISEIYNIYYWPTFADKELDLSNKEKIKLFRSEFSRSIKSI